MRLPFVTRLLCLAAVSLPIAGQGAFRTGPDAPWGNRLAAEHFRTETARIAEETLSGIRSLEDWTQRRETYRQQLLDMLGLWPLPERTDLQAVVTGRVDHPEFTVENVHFQSLPGMYVTGNLYIPKGLTGPAPTILYVCGHANTVRDGVSYGSKTTSYQRHGAWFARHGYVCLTIDTVQLGEIPGLHHGTHNLGMWWWNSRGYTPAGMEAWNSMRALDYLETRPEVDAARFGMTGRSGGGGYTWTTAAIDERIQAAVPVAGITDLEGYVVDGTVEGHCDCMFFLNTYQWDYPRMAALLAPRPLLISNSDKDGIFPVEGVVRLHAKVREIYRLYDAADKLGLLITEGPHRDTQDLQVPAFRWFNRHLTGEDPLIEKAARPFFQPEELKVFAELPEDEMNTRIHERFAPVADPGPPPGDSVEWARRKGTWERGLADRTFRGWPATPGPLQVSLAFAAQHDGLQLTAYEFSSQPGWPLRLYTLERAGNAPVGEIALEVLDEPGWEAWLAGMRSVFPGNLTQYELALAAGRHPDPGTSAAIGNSLRPGQARAWIAPRGIGPTAWQGSERDLTHIRRRFMMIGQTADGMRAWDIRRAIQALHVVRGGEEIRITLRADRAMAVNALYASIFESGLEALELTHLPASHRNGPDYLNVLKVLDIPQAATLAAEKTALRLTVNDPAEWLYLTETADRLGWSDRVELRRAE